VVLNHPKRLNALGPWFWDEMSSVMARINADHTIRVALLYGEGAAFSTGLDLQTMAPRLPLGASAPNGARQAAFHQLIRDLQQAITSVAECRVPVIAAIHGYCLGGGVDLATAADIRLASSDAVFGVRETRIAIVADVGTLQRLPRIISPGIARELAYTGRDFGATYAERIGLVNRVLPDRKSLVASAESLALEIAANAPLAVQGTKRVMNEADRADIARELEYVATWNTAHMISEDLSEAMAAFADRRTPTYTGQ
jgi:enoyl-CoA hydratase